MPDLSSKNRAPGLPRRALGLAALIAFTSTAGALECHSLTGPFDTEVCWVDTKQDPLEVRLAGPDGKPIESFAALKELALHQHNEILFAMNAGMFDSAHAPVGLLIDNARTVAALNSRRGLGNFYLRPNGVFYVTHAQAAVVTTDQYQAINPTDVILATQSGPMLVVSGEILSTLSPRSQSRFTRNGVGISSNGRIVFAISLAPVSLYDFAALFRDTLKCRNALYLDGHVSSLLTRDMTINGEGLGPMFVIFGHESRSSRH